MYADPWDEPLLLPADACFPEFEAYADPWDEPLLLSARAADFKDPEIY